MFGLYLLVALVTQFAPENDIVASTELHSESQKVSAQISLSNVSGLKPGTAITYKGSIVGSISKIKENRVYNKSVNTSDLKNNYSVEIVLDNDTIQVKNSNLIALVVNHNSNDSFEESKVIELLENKVARKDRPTNTKYIKGYSSYREFWMSRDV